MLTGQASGAGHFDDSGDLTSSALTTTAGAGELPLNAAVTQHTLAATTCRSGWTRSVQPKSHAMRAIKRQMLVAIGEPHANRKYYQLDHTIPLELGGAPGDRQNLALRLIKEAREKDQIESCLGATVCQGGAQLAAAQAAIWINWRAAAAICLNATAR